jgi:hypothetical protein
MFTYGRVYCLWCYSSHNLKVLFLHHWNFSGKKEPKVLHQGICPCCYQNIEAYTLTCEKSSNFTLKKSTLKNLSEVIKNNLNMFSIFNESFPHLRTNDKKSSIKVSFICHKFKLIVFIFMVIKWQKNKIKSIK